MHRSNPSRRLGRRAFVRGAAAAVGGYAMAASPMARAFTMSKRETLAAGIGGDGRPRVYTLVLDGLRPDEITAEKMPNLVSLVAEGASYSTARSAMVAETLPNHVSMATGVRPGTHGVVANDIYDFSIDDDRHASKPADIGVETIFGTLQGVGLTTATVVSKRYLHDVFEGAADHHWDPQPEIPESEHAPDVFTMEKVHEFVDDHDPDYLFANFGDIDRSGHVDETGPTGFPAFRTALLQNTDRLLGDFVTFLKDGDRWESSVLLITADHSMDWSTPESFIEVGPALDEDASLAGNYVLVDNGGAELVYWTGDPAKRADAVSRMPAIIADVEGVESVQTTAAAGLGARAGDVVAYCEPGWRFSDHSVVDRDRGNPIPGNHGHKVTQPIPFVVAGGAGFVQRDTTIDGVTARTFDVAPTVAWLFGVDGAQTVAETASRYEGSPLADAFGDLGRTVGTPAGGGETPPDTTASTVPTEVLGETAERPAQAPAGEPLPATGGAATAGVAGLAAGGAVLTFRQILSRALASSDDDPASVSRY